MQINERMSEFKKISIIKKKELSGGEIMNDKDRRSLRKEEFFL